MAKPHQFDAGVFVFDFLHEFADFVDATHFLNVFEHVQAGFIGAAVRRTPQAGNARGNGGERIGARRAAQTHRGGGGVLFMVGVQGEDAINRAFQHQADFVFFARRRKHHVQEVAGIGEVVARVHVGLAYRVLVGHGYQSRHFGDQANRRNFAVLRVVDVRAVVVKGRQGAHQASHDRHRMCVTAKATQEKLHLLVDHCVHRNQPAELCLASRIGQLPIQQQVTGFHVVAVGGKLFDRVAAVKQFTFVAINEGDGRLARRRRQKAWVIREHAGLGIEFANVDNIRPHAACVNRHFDTRTAIAEGQGGFVIR